MAVDVNSAEALRVKEALGSIGLIRSGDAAALRRSSVDALNRFYRLLVDDPNPPTVSTYDPGVVAKIKDGISSEFLKPDAKTGVTGLQNFQAVVEGNVSFLVKDLPVAQRVVASLALESIYKKYPDDRNRAVVEVLEFVSQGNEFAKKILPKLRAQGLINHTPAVLGLIKNSEQFFTDFETLEKAGLYSAAPAQAAGVQEDKSGVSAAAVAAGSAGAVDPASSAPMEEVPPDPAQILVQAVSTIKAAIGAPPGGEIGRADQDLLKQKILAFQNDAFFGEGWTGPKNGLYSGEFAAHLIARADSMPEGTEAEKAAKGDVRTFALALKTVSDDYGVDLISPKDKISPAEASQNVEMALGLMGPVLNGLLEEKSQQLNGKMAEMPDFLRGLVGMMAQTQAGSLLETRIPQVETADAVFDMRSQGSLQALLIVLGDRNVMNIPGLANGLYDPEAGQQILNNVGPLREKLRAEMAPEKFAEIESVLTREKLQPVIDSLDVLHAAGKIAREPLFVNNRAAELPGLAAGILTEEVSRLGQENPDALKLADGLIRQYTGFYGISGLLPGNEGLEQEIDVSKAPEKRLEEFYTKAKAKHLADGGTHESFNSEMLLILNTVLVLPFGSGEQRNLFNAGVREALSMAAGESDPARAAEIFARGVTSTGEEMAGKFGVAGFRQAYDDSRGVVWHPRLEGSSFSSGGKIYTAADIAKRYDDMNAARGAMRGMEGALFFKDDNGDTHVAAIHEETRMFMVVKVDKANMEKILQSGGDAAVIAEMKKTDPGFGLVFQPSGYLVSSYVGFAERVVAGGFASLPQEMAPQQNVAIGRTVDAQEKEGEKKPTIRLSSAPPPSFSSAQPAADGGGKRGRGSVSGDGQVYSVPHETGEVGANNSALRKELTDVGASLRKMPAVLHPGDPRLDVLQAAAGQEWRIGASYKKPFQLSGVDMSRADGAGPQVSWYDWKEKTVKVATAPEEMLHPGFRLMTRKEPGEPSQAYYERIQRDHPLLFEIARNYQGGSQRLKGEPVGIDDHWNFNVVVDRVAASLSQPPAQLYRPQQGQSWLAGVFSRGADENPAPVEDRSVFAESKPASMDNQTPRTRHAGSNEGGVLAGLRCEFDKIKTQIVSEKPPECGKTNEFKEAGQMITGPSLPDYRNYPGPGGMNPGSRHG